MDKRGKTKIAIYFFIIIATISTIAYAVFVMAAHDASVLITPNFTNSLMDQQYKLNIKNVLLSTNRIREVRIYDDENLDGIRDAGIADFKCGPAPSGWILTNRLADLNYCEYITTVNSSFRIFPGNSLNFIFNVSLSELNNVCGNRFRVSTIDDASPIGEVEFNFPEIKVDDLPQITK